MHGVSAYVPGARRSATAARTRPGREVVSRGNSKLRTENVEVSRRFLVRMPPVLYIRSALEGLGVARAGEYRTHDFRRGHAKDLQITGAYDYVMGLREMSACRSTALADSGGGRVEVARVLAVLGHAQFRKGLGDPVPCG